MFKLLKKELTLSINPQTIIFTLLVLLVAIPSWPAAVGFIYPISGLIVIFPLAVANHDIEYTSLLPIKKSDIVKAKVLFIIVIELATILISIPAVLIRNYVLAESVIGNINLDAPDAQNEINYYTNSKPSFMTYATILLGYGIFNIVLIPLYYKNPTKKLVGPQLIAMFAMLIVLGVGTAVQYVLMYFIPETFNIISIITLIVSFVVFLLFSFLAERAGETSISRIDL